MRSALITFFCAVASAVGGFAMPVAFPHVDQEVGQMMLVVSATLLVVAALLYVADFVQRKPQPSTETQPAAEGNSSHFAQSHSGVGHNIVAHEVRIGPRLIALDQETLDYIASKLDRRRPVAFAWKDHGRSKQLKATLEAYLRAKGFEISGNRIMFGEGYAPRLDFPLMIGSDGLQPQQGKGMTFLPGEQVIGIDGDIVVE